ncbi:MAG TPA: cation:proton antiporter, partial [Patescibacteria group bacterium]|nr:cation:proton antiporter [Patescibacteria group bacterium]
MDSYTLLIAVSSLVILSYIFNLASGRFKIPSVLLLIGTGIGLKFLTRSWNMDLGDLFPMLEILGIVGLIVIVLEGALDLHLSRDKMQLIRNSFLTATLILVATSVVIALIFQYFLNVSFLRALVYAIPLSVVSSAIVIPSVSSLSNEKREFMIYEATFSDILGIMLFNILTNSEEAAALPPLSSLLSVVITVILSVISTYLLIFFLNKIATKVRIFLMLAILILLYSAGKLLHLSSLLLILIFGLALNNTGLFFRGRMANFITIDRVKPILQDFTFITAETAFLVRTFFFVIFGYSFRISLLSDPLVLTIGTAIVLFLYFVRFINLKLVLKTSIYPEILLAPRGLITILLYYSIPEGYKIEGFSEGILFFIIITTSIIMMLGLITSPKKTAGYKGLEPGVNPSGNGV